MSEELLINVTPQETRVAYVENGLLQEVHIERERKRGIVGNIYKGKVVRVLPGMQAAFLEVGLDRTAFLHVSDIAQPNGKNGDGGEPSDVIMELLREGQELMVQVVKDPMGTKGARLTTQISFPSRYLVYRTGINHVGISQRIEDETERQRLKDIISDFSDEFEKGGYIARTVAEGISKEAIYKDMQFLQKIWMNILERNSSSNAAALIHEDMPLVMRTMRDLSGIEIEKVRIDSRSTFEKVQKFASKFIPELENRIEHYPGERPVFDLYSIEDEIQKH